MYAVILAGGGGTRLWPLSRPETPKPFLPLLGDRSLLQLTFDRIVGHPELELAPKDVTVVTDRRYSRLVHAQVPGVRVIAEPAGRNTAAAIALATLLVERPEDEVMLVLPADQRIVRDDVYRDVLRNAQIELARGAFDIELPLVTLGIEVSRAATEYGYLVPDMSRHQGTETRHRLSAYRLQAFVEKPNPERAMQLWNDPGVAWNAGIFLWQRRAIREALSKYTSLLTYFAPVVRNDAALTAAYERVRPLSIDTAVMEGAATDGRVVMGSMDVGWDDLGSWSSLLAAIGGTGGGRVVAPGTPADAGPDDLVIERIDGRLAIGDGPRSILAQSPVALLAGAAPGRQAVEALVERVSAWEERA